MTADTGPMHIAVAVGTRVVSIFGPADPRRTGPFGSEHVVLRSPAWGGEHRPDAWTQDVTVDEVAREVARLVE